MTLAEAIGALRSEEASRAPSAALLTTDQRLLAVAAAWPAICPEHDPDEDVGDGPHAVADAFDVESAAYEAERLCGLSRAEAGRCVELAVSLGLCYPDGTRSARCEQVLNATLAAAVGGRRRK